MSLSFISEQVSFDCPNQESLEKWLTSVCSEENKQVGDLTYIFCSDEYLLNINQKHLQHDHYTDVITFDYSENNIVSGDLFISIDRVKDNAQKVGCPFIDELHRVMVHGLLHLLGYNDKTAEEKSEMRAREGHCLRLRGF